MTTPERLLDGLVALVTGGGSGNSQNSLDEVYIYAD
jgi:hypothetical protein